MNKEERKVETKNIHKFLYSKKLKQCNNEHNITKSSQVLEINNKFLSLKFYMDQSLSPKLECEIIIIQDRSYHLRV